MKELSIEEKAKAYDEVVEKAKNCLKDGTITNTAISYIETLIPELKECEDEKIRRCIGMCLTDADEQRFKDFNTNLKDCLIWLEKQGEHANFRNKIQIGDKVTRNEYGVLVNLSQLNRVAKKQGEQKLADKVEPKFKAGDWVVVNDGRIGRIIECTKDFADIDLEFSCLSTSPNNIRSWTIQDAKDGDVLASNRSIFIFSQEYMAGKTESYCGIMNGLFIVKPECCWTNEKCYPATKEQRDALIKVMADAGYTFDFEKKELKKLRKE